MESDGSPLRIDAAPLPWYNTRPLGFYIPRCSRSKDISIPSGVVCVFQRRVSYRLRVSRLRTNSATPGIVSNKVNFLFLVFLYIQYATSHVARATSET